MLPSRLAWIPRGRLPNLIVVRTSCLRGSITLRSPDPSLVTYTVYVLAGSGPFVTTLVGEELQPSVKPTIKGENQASDFVTCFLQLNQFYRGGPRTRMQAYDVSLLSADYHPAVTLAQPAGTGSGQIICRTENGSNPWHSLRHDDPIQAFAAFVRERIRKRKYDMYA